MRLYRSHVLPVAEYGAPVWVSAVTEGCKEFGKIQRSAMLMASGCLISTSSEALEILTNTVQMDLQLKLRQAQEAIRISVKYDNDPLKMSSTDDVLETLWWEGTLQFFIYL